MSARAISLRLPGRAGAKKKSKRSKKRSRGASLPAEYNMLLTATLCLLAFGAVMVFSASSTTRVLSDGGLSDSVYYLKRTAMFGALGLLIMHLAARTGLDFVRRMTPAILAISFFLLFAVLFAGTNVNGSSRWIGSGFLQIQPSELAKVALILYGADLFARKPKRVRTLEGMMPFLLVVGVSALLIIAEPDLGTTLVIAFASAATLVAAGARMRDLVIIALVLGFFALLMTLVEPYRMARLTAFLNPGADTTGTGFQAAQAKIALGSGGLFGVGIGNGIQKAYYLPEAHTDMITAVIGEELGLRRDHRRRRALLDARLRGPADGKKSEGRLRQGPRRRADLADPGPGDGEPVRGDGAGPPHGRPAPVRLIREQQPAGIAFRGRPDPQRRPRRDRRRWQTARRRWRAKARAWKEWVERCQSSQEWWWRPGERQDTSCPPWRSPPSFGIAAPRSAFLGTRDRIEAELVPSAGYEIDFIKVRGIDRGNPLQGSSRRRSRPAWRWEPPAPRSGAGAPTS